MSAAAFGLPALFLATAVLLLVEIRQYRAGRHMISRRRFALRLAAGVLLMALCSAIFVGLFVLRLTNAGSRTGLFAAFWLSCMLVAGGLMWVMVQDMQEVEDRFSQRQHEIWRDMAQFVAKQLLPRHQGGREPKPGGKTDE
jgi:hypothetical protein